VVQEDVRIGTGHHWSFLGRHGLESHVIVPRQGMIPPLFSENGRMDAQGKLVDCLQS